MSTVFSPSMSARHPTCRFAACPRPTLVPREEVMSVPETVISRRADGSIDHEHYSRLAHNLRARQQRQALAILIAPVHWLLGATRRRERPHGGTSQLDPER